MDGLGSRDGSSAAICSASSVRVQSGQVYSDSDGGRLLEANSSGLDHVAR